MLNMPDLPVKYIDGKRHYGTPEGKWYPSVTTVLSCIPKPELVAWREAIGDEEADRQTKVASVIGNRLHDTCEKYLRGEEWRKGLMPDILELFRTIQPHIDHIEEVWGIETPLYSDYLRIGGRTDVIGVWDDVPSIIDFKNSRISRSKDFVRAYFMQEAAYAVAVEERTGQGIPQLVTIMACREDPQPCIFVESRNDWIKEFIQVRKDYAALV
jgi:hypothetical protein